MSSADPVHLAPVTCREMVERVRLYMSDCALSAALKARGFPGFSWHPTLLNSPKLLEQEPLDGALRGPAEAAWMYSEFGSYTAMAELLPESWDVSPDEWRLSRV